MYVCRDKSCDIRIVNKEVSRRHLEIYVNEDGNVCLLSMGREPVCLNGEQVLSPRVLQTGDKIEVLLEGRTREFFFKAAHTESLAREDCGQNVGAKAIGSPLAASSIANQLPNPKSGQEIAQEDMDIVPKADMDIADAVMESAPEQAIHDDVDRKENAALNQVDDVVVDEKMEPTGQPDLITEAVSHMVNEIISKIVQSAEAASSILTPVSNNNKRKSVRFVAMTPEGEACEATMTIRCTPQTGNAIIVEDNTVAFSEWGFKTMAKDQVMEDQIEEKDCVPDAKEIQGASVENRMTPIPEDLDYMEFHSGPSQTTPCLAAPATTPVTLTKSGTAKKRCREVDFNALAQKLGEIADEHHVHFELPKDFMRFTPLSTAKSKKLSIGEVQSCQSGPSKRLSVCSTSREDGHVEFDLPKDFLRFTPLSAPAKSTQNIIRSGISEESGKDFELPKGFMRFTPSSVSAMKKQSSSTNGTMDCDLPKDFMRFTPMSVPSKRMDGKKIKSALKVIGQQMSAIATMHESDDDDDGAEEIATLRSVGHAVHDLADALDRVASVKKSVKREKPPGVKITIVEKGNTFKTSNPEVKVLFGGMSPLDTNMDDVQNQDALIQKGNISTKAGMLSRFKSALVQANSYRTQSLVLGKHLRKSSAKLNKFKTTARVLSTKYKAERAKRLELQTTLKKLIEARENDSDHMVIEDEEENGAIQRTRVVVVGHKEKNQSRSLEMAGNVVVVRKSTTSTPYEDGVDDITPNQEKTAKKSLIASALKSAVKSVRRISIGNETQLVMDDIKMPMWIYDKEEEEDGKNGDMEDEREHVDLEEQTALDTLEKSLQSPLPNGPSEEEENMAEDICHICHVGDDGDILLLCDSCDNACHLQCCKPALKRVPKGDWYCVDCKQKSKAAPKREPSKRKAPAAKKSPATKRRAKENTIDDGSKTKSGRSTAKNKVTNATTRPRRTRATAKHA